MQIHDCVMVPKTDRGIMERKDVCSSRMRLTLWAWIRTP
jgi:hypothetical protein